MDPRLVERIRQLLHKAHDVELPEQLEEKMIMDLYIQLEQKFDAAVLQELSAEDRVRYGSLLERGVEQKELEEFLGDQAPVIQGKLLEVLEHFEEEYITLCKQDS